MMFDTLLCITGALIQIIQYLTYRDEILSGERSPGMSNPYIYGIFRTTLTFTITIFTFQWKMKTAFLLSSSLIHFGMYSEGANEDFFIMLIVTVCCMLLVG